MVRFQVARVDDLPMRAGLLVAGREMEGSVTRGATLLDESTRQSWEVLALEFPTPRARQEGLTTLLVARTEAEPPAPGTHLVA